MDKSANSQLRERLKQSPVDAARYLLGAYLSTDRGGLVVLRITEVEAYAGEQDPGSHAYRGPNARNQVMFGPPGHLYVYRHLGLHTCLNVTCDEDGVASALLVRSGEIVAGADLARSRREATGVVRQPRDLARGPGRLTVALGVTMDDAGVDLLAPDAPVRLESGAPIPAHRVQTGPRVGVSGPGGDGEAFPWRFYLADDHFVSDYTPGSDWRFSSRTNSGKDR